MPPLGTAGSSASSSAGSSTATNPAGSSSRGASDSQISPIRTTIDLVAAARWHLSFLRSLSDSPILHHAPTILRSIRRYEDLWMPLIAELSAAAAASPPPLLPPADVHWVWHCHCLNPASYAAFCAARFGALVARPAIFDDENEEYAVDRCREVWEIRYPSEPFDLEVDDGDAAAAGAGDLFDLVSKHKSLPAYFSDPFFFETVYLVAARRRYLRFLHLSTRGVHGGSRLVPASDILLMWLTHQSFPGRYARDAEGMGDLRTRVLGLGIPAAASEEEEETTRAWEEAFDEPYETAGAVIAPASSPARVFFNWEPPDADVNRRYKGLQPRFLMEVLIFFKGIWEEKETKDANATFLRLRTVRCHREMKMDRPVTNSSFETWSKAWHLYSEFGSRGIVIEVRRHGSSCLRSSKLLKKVVFLWNDLLRSTSLGLKRELQKQVSAMSSVTPPVQAPYLLKCVPDRVTDDSGTMVSDVILRMNQYHPQKGRWLSRTVLDHSKRECFVIRIRVGKGIWRRGAENPTPVDWEDRITEVREGQWSYVASSIGSAPEKVVGTAVPVKSDSQEKKAIWRLSMGDVLSLLTIRWEDGLSSYLENENSTESVSLLQGRKLQYQVKESSSCHIRPEEEEHYVTVVRFSSERPDGRATALLNWKLLAVEFIPEEDAILVLLLCMSIVRTISEIRKEDVGGLLVRRRLREVQAGQQDWGSVMLPSPCSSPQFQPWYWNAEEVLASAETTDARQITFKHSPADGIYDLYKQAIYTKS